MRQKLDVELPQEIYNYNRFILKCKEFAKSKKRQVMKS